MKEFELLLRGFGGNLLITAATVCLLLLPGILLTLLAKKVPVIGKIFGWLSIPFECICPVALILALYLSVQSIFHLRNMQVSTNLAIILGLTIAYMGYMPARFVPEYSFLKNILYNGLGMISAVFKWSFCAFIIGGQDIIYYARNLMYRAYRGGYYWIPLVVAFACLLILEVARRVIKQFMK